MLFHFIWFLLILEERCWGWSLLLSLVRNMHLLNLGRTIDLRSAVHWNWRGGKVIVWLHSHIAYMVVRLVGVNHGTSHGIIMPSVTTVSVHVVHVCNSSVLGVVSSHHT